MPNVLLRVYLMDNTHKTVYVDPETTTIEELWGIMSQKLLLSTSSAECFFIWAISRDVELLLYAEQTVQDVYEDWPSIQEKYCVKRGLVKTLRRPPLDRSPSKMRLDRSPSARTGMQTSKSTLMAPTTAPSPMQRAKSAVGFQRTKSAGGSLGAATGFGVSAGLADAETDSFKLVFRPTAVLPLYMERSLVQPEAIHLLYIQAVHHVIQSNYPLMKDSAIMLGGVQLQIALGDQKTEHIQHIPESLDSYIPEHLRGQRKVEEWVNDLVAAHQQHRGKDPVSLKRQYIDSVQRFPFYGSTFFKAKYIPSVTSFYKQDYQGTVSLGINHTGIHIIDPKLMKFESWNFHNLVFWDSLHATFVFEGANSQKVPPTRRCTFKTPQAELINDLMHDWAEEWQRQVAEGRDSGPDGAEMGTLEVERDKRSKIDRKKVSIKDRK